MSWLSLRIARQLPLVPQVVGRPRLGRLVYLQLDDTFPKLDELPTVPAV